MARRSKADIQKDHERRIARFYELVSNRQPYMYEDEEDEVETLADVADWHIKEVCMGYIDAMYLARTDEEKETAAKALVQYMQWIGETYM